MQEDMQDHSDGLHPALPAKQVATMHQRDPSCVEYFQEQA
jgi:hypothetical protein